MSTSSVVSLVARKIGELLVEEAKMLYGVKDEVGSLQEELMMIRSYLIDMEAMDEEGRGDARTSTTIQQIRKIAYDTEDVIESYIVKVGLSDEKADFFKRYCCSCSSVVSTHQIGYDIVAIKTRIVETRERWIRYSGATGVGGRSTIVARQGRNKRNRPIAYPHSIEDHVVGLDEDINKLVGVLTSGGDEDKSNGVQVVSFVGMGGSGKTTLARKLYKHEIVIKHFDRVAWVSISQQWNLKQVILDLLQKIGGGGKNEDSSQVLVEKLHECLERTRSLIFLDDVWEKEVLEQILPAIPLRSDSGKIIVTTRNQSVVDFPDIQCFTHEPRRLSEEESGELFRKIALIHTLDINPELEALGKNMLEKCKGLPLAVIALAGILSKKESIEEWEKTKRVVSSRIMEDGCGTHLYGPVNQMIALSYYDLPNHLKPCFLYLAMFPEDHDIPVGNLIRMWIAEGFIASDELHEGETIEDLAHEYVDELVQRCVVQIARKNFQGKVKKIRIHDLVRDLCIKKAKEENFIEGSYFESPNPDRIVTESRRTAIYSRERKRFQIPTQNRHLRSLLCKGEPDYFKDEAENYFAQLEGLKATIVDCMLLRVLLLQDVTTSDGTLPKEIGRLIHLRYLGLKNTNISQLPSSIGELRNLLILDYREVRGNQLQGKGIPDVVWKLKGLRYLYLPNVYGDMHVENLRLDTLNKLQTLAAQSCLGGDCMLKELPNLSPSVQKLILTNIKSSHHLETALQCPSIRSDRLRSLSLEWNGFTFSGVMKMHDFGPLMHCQSLRELKLTGDIGECVQFPTFITMLKLEASSIKEETTLSALGKLPNLTKLELWFITYVGKTWTCFAGEFPKLEEFLVVELSNLEEWEIERGAMPQLKKLSLTYCKELRSIPKGLQFITTLQELRASQMSDEFNMRLRGEDAHIIQHIPLVHHS